MASLVRLRGGNAELPYLSLRYPVAPAESSLGAGFAAFRDLQHQVGLQSLPLAQREEVVAFLRRFGRLLYRTLFPDGQGRRLHPGEPLLIDTDSAWSLYPWELLHDGSQWLALQQGVVRFHATGGGPEPRGAVSSVLAAAAVPVSVGADDALSTAYRTMGSRFITPVTELPESSPHNAGIAWRVLEHADWKSLEQALTEPPEILLWSGMVSTQGWLLEGKHLEPEAISIARIAAALKAAVKQGLRLAVVNDSLGLGESALGAEHAGVCLAAGLPALVRIEGAQARVRQQDYVRALARHMAQGYSAFESHLSAIRRLHRRFESGWDWSYLRFHTGRAPVAGDSTGPRSGTARESPRAGSRPVSGDDGALEMRTSPASPDRPAPPVFCRRRRVFARHAELRALAQALLPDPPSSSPLVFLTGPAGSGKTVLALDIARRLHRHFDETIYLEAKDLLSYPDPDAGSPFPAAPPPLERLSTALALRIGAAPQAGVAGEDWRQALLRGLQDGARRLVVLDGLEGQTGYDAWLALLSGAPAGTNRLLVTGRGAAPILPGFRVELRPADAAAVEAIFDSEFLERARSREDGGLLFDLLRRDLLVARLMRRLARWPEPAILSGLLTASTGQGTQPRDAVLAWALDQALREISALARRALEALVVLTGLVHRDVIAAAAELSERESHEAAAALQWHGFADAHDGERYLSLHPRLIRMLGERLMTRPVFGNLAPRLIVAYETYLAAAGQAVSGTHSRSAWHAPESGFSWWPSHRPQRNSADPRDVQRLAVERSNLAELSTILLEEGNAHALGRLVDESRPLAALAWQSGLQLLLGTHLYKAACSPLNEVIQARALNCAGEALLAREQAQPASALLERAVDLASRNANWEILSESYLLLARAYVERGQIDAAENLLLSAVELGYQLGAGGPLTAALTQLAALWRRRGSAAESAEQILPRAIGFLEARHQFHLAARIKRLLGEARREAGYPERAETDLRDALREFQRAGDRREAGVTGILLANVLAAQERSDAAQDVFDKSAGWLIEAHAADPDQLASALQGIAKLYERQRRVPEALQAWRRVRDWRQSAGDREGVMAVLDVLGSLYFRLGEQEQSTRCYEERMLLQSDMASAARR